MIGVCIKLECGGCIWRNLILICNAAYFLVFVVNIQAGQ